MSPRAGSLASLGTAVTRHARLVMACLIAGVALGAVYTAVRPPAVTAQTSVLLPAASVGANGQPARDMKTQAEIATSVDVLTRAAATLHSSASLRSLASHIKVSAASEDVLVIAAHESSRASAVALANAVANAYVAYNTSSANDQSNTVTTTLSQRVTQLTNEIRDLQDQIATADALQATLAPGSPEAAHESSVIAGLQTQETDAAAQLNSINTQIDNARVNQVLAGVGTKIIDPASNASPESPVHRGLPIGLGGLVGLIGASIVAVQLEQRDRRLRWRDDIADAIGVPVIASLTTPRRAGPREIGELLDRSEPSPVDAWSIRRALRYMGADDDEGALRLSVVSLSDDPAALLVGPIMARFAASLGVPTTLRVTARDPAAASLRAAAHANAAPSPNLQVIDSDDDGGADEGSRLVIAVHVHDADPSRRTQLAPGRGTILAVSSNAVTADELAELAIASADAGLAVLGIVVANPDDDDSTTGRFPQPARPATTIPRRVTGTTTKDSA